MQERGGIVYQKIAVAIIHGMGSQQEGYAKKTVEKIKRAFAKEMEALVNHPADQLVIESILWAPIFEPKEMALYNKTVMANQLHFKKTRRFVISYLGDAIAYRPVETGMQNYERVHEKIGEDLHALARRVGSQAPLCVISHSLGSVIASNYFYDLQYKLQRVNCVVNRFSPFERGDTLTLFYTVGTTLPLWSLRYDDFIRPIHILSSKLPEEYLTDRLVIDPIVDGLCRTWRDVNGI